MAVSTLAGTKWLLNELLDLSDLSQKAFSISGRVIESGHALNFGAIYCANNRQLGITYSYFIQGSVNTQVRTMYENGSYTTGWGTYGREILIAGGNNETNATLIAWFEQNATLIPSYTLQEKEAIPSADVQEITPDEGFDGLSKVTVQRVENENLIPENIRKDVDIFGVVGTFEHEPDENLIPANIKKGVEILGVTGTFDGFDPSNPIAQMTNLAGSGQDQFVHDWAQMAKIQLHEQGVSNAFLATDEAQFILAKAVTDLIEDGTLSATTLSLIATLRVNHPHTEDDEEEATQNV